MTELENESNNSTLNVPDSRSYLDDLHMLKHAADFRGDAFFTLGCPPVKFA